MLTIPGYEIHDTLHQGVNSIVLRATRQTDHLRVILKCLVDEYPSPHEVDMVQREFDTLSVLDSKRIRKAYCVEKYKNGLVLVLEDFDSEPLSEIKTQNLTIQEFLKLASNLARAVGDIHTGGVIHKDINPSNILHNSKTGEVKITDFNISTTLLKERVTGFEGTLSYVSPEQTGRMNRSLDYRSDYYSLGVTLYELLIGKLPFV